jgi:hypothetical protein
MSEKLVYLCCFILALGLTGGVASADPLHQDPGPDGIVSVEAEHFDENVPLSGAEWMEVGPTDGFTGEAGMQVLGPSFYSAGYAATSPRLEYEINFVKTGTHYVWILAWAAGGADDSCHVGLDGEETPLSSNWSGGGNNWSNGRYPETGRAQFEVTTTGLHTLDIWVREDGLIVDKIVLTTNPDYTPTGNGPEESHRGLLLNAYNPNPAEGELYEDIWASLSWSAGATAVSHDVYFSDNFDDVNDGTADAFRGNQPSTIFIVGFPGMPYPDSLVPGTTYYWRVDEIEADGTTIHKGYVWNFTIPPRTAYDPDPVDRAPFIDPDASLSWTAGFGTKLHYVYFGDNFDDVNSGVVGTTQGTTRYTPGPLEYNKVYYWRVDEFDGLATYKGDVWSFKTAKAGGGVRADYYKGMNFENHVLNRTDPRIDFNWGDPGSPDASVGDDNFSVRWTGDVEVAFTETYTFYTNSDDGVRLWVDGQQLVDNWTDHSATENSGTIDLIAGNAYSIVMEYYENTGGAVAELRWSSPSTPKQLIPQAALSPPVKAGSPNPLNGATDVSMAPVLKWKPGDYATSHDVYFGTDEDAVKNATTASPEYKGSRAPGSESFVPGDLPWEATYYWRVDEVNDVNPDSPWIGSVWSFTTGDFLVADDFEDYNDYPPYEIFSTWIDGWEVPTNGSLAGHPEPPFAETMNVYGGSQSMPLYYDNNLKYSEAEMSLSPPQDWTRQGVTVLSIMFLGDSNNSIEQIYVKVNGVKVLYDGDPFDITRPRWTRWNIDLTSFGVNLRNVTELSIGFGDEANLRAGGSGVVYFDNIRLYRSAPPEVAVSSEEIWLEAEAADTITAPFQVYTELAGASGGKYIGTTDDVGNSSSNPPFPDGTASYTFTVAGGTYKISCRIIIPAGDSFWFRIPGATTQTTNHSSGWVRWSDPPDSEAWYWEDVFSAEDDGETVLFTMEAGTYTLEVGYREDAAWMDTILISKID